jgi:hypothetical protein
MKLRRLPGFTAEAGIRNSIGHYRAVAATTTDRPELTPALRIGPEPDWVDCKEFPNNITCQECGNTGPGSVRCCRNANCAVIDSRPVLTYRGAPALRR